MFTLHDFIGSRCWSHDGALCHLVGSLEVFTQPDWSTAGAFTLLPQALPTDTMCCFVRPRRVKFPTGSDTPHVQMHWTGCCFSLQTWPPSKHELSWSLVQHVAALFRCWSRPYFTAIFRTLDVQFESVTQSRAVADCLNGEVFTLNALDNCLTPT